MSIPIHLMRKYAIIYNIAVNKRPSRAFLCECSGSSSTAFTRSLHSLSTDYGMRVLFIADGSGITRQSGFYRIDDWGIIDKKAFIDWYPTRPFTSLEKQLKGD